MINLNREVLYNDFMRFLSTIEIPWMTKCFLYYFANAK